MLTFLSKSSIKIIILTTPTPITINNQINGISEWLFYLLLKYWQINRNYLDKHIVLLPIGHPIDFFILLKVDRYDPTKVIFIWKFVVKFFYSNWQKCWIFKTIVWRLFVHLHWERKIRTLRFVLFFIAPSYLHITIKQIIDY